MDSNLYEEDLELALHAAHRAGEVVMRHFRQDLEVHYKEPDQPVCAADVEADRMLHKVLVGARPGYGWLSEETADSAERLERSHVWIVDPIDGTRSFLDGHPEFVVSIGLAVRGVAVLGAVYNPATGELYHAIRGMGAFLNGTPLRMPSTLVAGAPGVILASRSEIKRGQFEAFRGGWEVQPLGSTAYKMVKVADGTGDVYLSRGPKSEWDVCAAALVVSEAGGRATALDGSEIRYNRPDPFVDGVLVANGPLHSTMLQQLAALPPVARMRAKEVEQ